MARLKNITVILPLIFGTICTIAYLQIIPMSQIIPCFCLCPMPHKRLAEVLFESPQDLFEYSRELYECPRELLGEIQYTGPYK